MRRHRAKEVLDEELEAPRAIVKDDEEHDLVDHDMAEPQRPIDSSTEVSLKRKLAWADPGCEKIWCPRKVSQGEQETSYIFELYGTII